MYPAQSIGTGYDAKSSQLGSVWDFSNAHTNNRTRSNRVRLSLLNFVLELTNSTDVEGQQNSKVQNGFQFLDAFVVSLCF